MKVLLINGSPREDGCTATALKEMIEIFQAEGVETVLFNLGTRDVRGCVACHICKKIERCVYNDVVNELAKDLDECDGLVRGSPVYYASPNGSLLALLDRLFVSTGRGKTMKVGAAVVSARRAGTTASLDVLNKYFSISGMPIGSGQYWNMVHGNTPAEVARDKEGLQNLRTVARNMVFLMRSIALGKEAFGLPLKEPRVATNFIR